MADFEPRSAKAPGFTEITYTGTDDVAWSPGDEIPPGADIVDVTKDDGVDADGNPKPRKYVARRLGVQKTLKATDGVFHPRDAEDEAALRAFDLPVARETKSEAKSDSKGG